jgi:hypothetical protein
MGRFRVRTCRITGAHRGFFILRRGLSAPERRPRLMVRKGSVKFALEDDRFTRAMFNKP